MKNNDNLLIAILAFIFAVIVITSVHVKHTFCKNSSNGTVEYIGCMI